MPIVLKTRTIRKDDDLTGGELRTWQTQQSMPIDYSSQMFNRHHSLRADGNLPWLNSGVMGNINDHRGLQGLAYAKAYDSFYSNAGGTQRASLGVTLASANQSWAMIADRSMRIVRALRHARRGHLGDAAEILFKGSSARARKLRKRESLSDTWLELQFGWLPLYGDIYQACEVLSSSLPIEKVRGSGHAQIFDQYGEWGNTVVQHKSHKIGTKRVRLSGQLKTVSPNVLLAKNLGLTNPAAVAWDLVPFSFVVDWFLPVNKFVQSWDSHLGFDVTNTAASVELKIAAGYSRALPRERPPLFFYTNADLREYDRTPSSFPLPSFGDRVQPLSGSWWRAVTSVALAVQQLRKLG